MGRRVILSFAVVAVVAMLMIVAFQVYLVRNDLNALRTTDTKLADLLTKMKEFKEGVGCEIRDGRAYVPGMSSLINDYNKAKLEYARAIETDFNHTKALLQKYSKLPDLELYATGLFKSEHDDLMGRINAKLSRGQQELSCH